MALRPKSAIYIRKALQLNPREQQKFGDLVKISATINKDEPDLLNVYSPGRSHLVEDEL